MRKIKSKMSEVDGIKKSVHILGTFLTHNSLSNMFDKESKNINKNALLNNYKSIENNLVNCKNPIIGPGDIDSEEYILGVADPFLMPRTDNVWDIFFEIIYLNKEPDSAIGHAISYDQGSSWKYTTNVLEPETHISFPFIFANKNQIYMVPEEGGNSGKKVHLYKSTNYPNEWKRINTIIDAEHYIGDTVLFKWNGYWWALTGDSKSSNLYVYYSKNLKRDNWSPHNKNPVVTARPAAERPAGRPLLHKNNPVLFFQDGSEQYGGKVRVYELTKLNPEIYEDSELDESPILSGSGALLGWNSGRMHHIDPHCINGNLICAIDGDLMFSSYLGSHWSIGLI